MRCAATAVAPTGSPFKPVCALLKCMLGHPSVVFLQCFYITSGTGLLFVTLGCWTLCLHVWILQLLLLRAWNKYCR